MELKDPAVTKKHIKAINDALEYFDEVVLCTPAGLHEFHFISPARADDRLYIHGVKRIPEDD
ncbi:hypothetical protein DRN34_02740 [Thermococci archaeon]|nr:MAG: hypothetical protein DRN34_02740 [Thermococci archaeon]